ncbi:MAG TPA: AAA family ATPase [Bacteroidales bacterium]|nr:AAA family ATPase [Bacteroidales bacterium]HQB21396.1 AAA family ATPase [Bacteroidales bacterium]
MDKNQINIKLNNIRSIKDANIILDGITVIAGENGSGKSTISKLTYHLFSTSIDFDKIVDKNLQDELRQIYRTLDQLSRDLSYFIDKDEYLKIRNSFRNIYRNESQLSVFEEDNVIFSAIDYLIDMFSNEKKIPQNKPQISWRLERIRMILGDSFLSAKDEKSDITTLLINLKSVINKNFNNSLKYKENRPLSILDEKLVEAFYDSPLPNSFNIFEYGVPIIDRQNNKLLPIHTIQKVAYIDTPMILGIDFYAERAHWEDINEIITKKQSYKSNSELESIFRKEILKGDVNFEDKEITSKTFTYKREDGKEFDLLECATGLKSFSLLQLLYKNGFLSNKTLLIIDEPEVHLHPQWVVEYARLVVLLNKHLGVKFLLASHHPDMISAIKYISEKENTSGNLHFYLANQYLNSFTYNYKDLGVEIEDIFSSFNIALERIDSYGQSE